MTGSICPAPENPHVQTSCIATQDELCDENKAEGSFFANGLAAVRVLLWTILLLLTAAPGCRSVSSPGSSTIVDSSRPSTADSLTNTSPEAAALTEQPEADSTPVQPPTSPVGDASSPQDAPDDSVAIKPAAFSTSTGAEETDPDDQIVLLRTVIDSVHQYYPMVQAAWLEQQVADGNQLAAWGEFDTKLKASSENRPLGFYETYRNQAGFVNPLYSGGQVFGGYRNGGGDFPPWYKERETNDGGEFKAGVRVPLIRDRNIDARRAELWRATYEQQMANPYIRRVLIEFTAEAGLAYWKWVAAGRKYQVGQQWLQFARARNDQIRRRVEAEDLDPPELIDNERAIAKREAKLAESRRDLQQSAVKLSLFLRDSSGQPVVPSIDQQPEFPPLFDPDQNQLNADILAAQTARPELTTLNLQIQQLRVDFAEACNLTLPALDAQLTGSQDVGEPTSSKRDKSEFELEAGLYFDVPLQRRKGRGKMYAVRAKIAQTMAKRRLLNDKIAADVRSAYAGLEQSRLEVLKAREAVRLASEMADIERRRFELGDSDLLKVALREQYALEAAEEEVSATLSYFQQLTLYAATMAIDRPGLWLLDRQVAVPAEE